jgi:ribosome-associated toxin RatA of RatAB toxin-antitoxin module
LAKLETEHVFNKEIEKVFAGIGQFDKYPQYLPGVTDIKVLPAKIDGSFCQVQYDLNIIKKFYYVLNMFEEKPNRIWWNLDSSNLMKVNDGSWDLTALDDSRTKAVYSLDIKFKGLVPSKITDTVAKANLPAMFEGFSKLISDHT